MKKHAFILFIILSIAGTAQIAGAGSNIFSSDNEQYSIAASTYQNLAAIYGYKAESNYLRYMLHLQNGEDDKAQQSLEAYHNCLDEAQLNAAKADEYLQKIMFTIPLDDDFDQSGSQFSLPGDLMKNAVSEHRPLP